MSFPWSQSSSSSKESGLKSEFSAFTRSAGSYLQARAELLAIEGAEAAEVVRKRLIKGIIAAFFLGISYLVILIAGIALGGIYLSEKTEGPLASWIGIALAAGVLHLLIGLILLGKTRKKNTTPFFEYTRSEWEKDQQWIQQKNKSGK
ncbi:MAG: phage holin family protein [Akkermansiaceae bacterium]